MNCRTTKCAVALAIARSDGKVLFVHRSSKYDHEYKDYWSLPSITVPHLEFETIINNECANARLLNELSIDRLGGISVYGGQLLAHGARCRSDYDLLMCVCAASSKEEITSVSEKYDECRYFNIEDFLIESKRKFGTCCSLYLQSLVRTGKLDPALSYFEIPPEIADSTKAIEDFSDHELWDISEQNFRLLVHGHTEGEGSLIRELVLNRYLKQYIDTKITPQQIVADIGCGDGCLLKLLSDRGIESIGLDFVDHSIKTDQSPNVIIGNACESSKYLGKSKYDIAFMNLLVFWIGDLDAAFREASSILKHDATFVLSSTVPELTKNGHWTIESQEYNWTINRPFSRCRSLEMINRSVGPFWFYPHTTSDIITAAANNNMYCIKSEDLYIDSFLNEAETQSALMYDSKLQRHQKFPCFRVMQFRKIISS